MNERLDRTQALPTEAIQLSPPKQRQPGFQPGKAAVPPQRPPAPTPPAAPHIVTHGQLKRPVVPLRERLRLMRVGSGWTTVGSIVLLISWGLWASDSGGDVIGEALILALIFLVALGLFAVCRLLGGVVLEKMLGRTRRGAVLSHLTIGLFLSVVGVKLLSQVSWIIAAVNYVRGVR